jgi:5'-deoxynucleotidase YfbR-like HD superfamily hydrolase
VLPSSHWPLQQVQPALHAGEEIAQLWREYEQGQTPEARLVKDFDKVGGGAHPASLHK